MCYALLFVIISFLLHPSVSSPADSASPPVRRKVVVIGGGIAGAATASFLGDYGDIDVTVVEGNSHLGGRVFSTAWTPEIGASVYHDVNAYMASFVKRLNLTTALPYAGGGTMGLWNHSSHSVVFATSPGDLMTMGRSLWRYGRDALWMQRAREAMVERLLAIYPKQEEGTSYETAEEMLEDLGLAPFLTMSLTEYLASFGVRTEEQGGVLLQEMVRALCCINYGQDETINALAGCVALKGRGKELHGVVGGNKRIVEGLLKAHDVRTNARATHISRDEYTKLYKIQLSNGESVSDVDAIVVAAPWETANLTFHGMPADFSPPQQPSYVTTHVTFVAGVINATYFDADTGADDYHTMLIRVDRGGPFRSLGKTRHFHANQSVYKIFSDNKVHDEYLRHVFSDVVEVYRFTWQGAYPFLAPLKKTSEPPAHFFSLGFNIFHVSALEYAVSTMETQSIAARNVALLVRREFLRHNRTIIPPRPKTWWRWWNNEL